MQAKASAIKRPEADEYELPAHEQYIKLVTGNDVIAALEAQGLQMANLFAAHSERDAQFRYAPDKWTVKEVLGHVIDTERIMTYRALCIARGEQTPLPGFDQDDYVRMAEFSGRSLEDLAEEFAAVRAATVALFTSLPKESWNRRGTASQCKVSVRAIAFIVAGHELHHRNILEERYFPAIPRA